MMRWLWVILWMAVTPVLQAAKPIFAIIPTTATTIPLPVNGNVTVQYRVTNQTYITRTLTIKPIQGVTQSTIGTGACASPFTLAPNQSCLLNLLISGGTIPLGIHGGPVVCKTNNATDTSADPFLCAQPGPNDRLNITIDNSVASAITVTPADLTLLANQFGTITVFNSSIYPAYNVFFPPPNVSPLVTTTDCPFILNSGATCTIQVSSPVATHQIVPVNGSNTVPPSHSVNVVVAQFAYIPNSGTVSPGTITKCVVSSVNGSLSACVLESGAPVSFGLAAVAVFNQAGNKAYVLNNETNFQVSFCDVTVGGAFSSCQYTGVPAPNFSSNAFAFNPARTFAYILNSPTTLAKCSVNSSTGIFENCVDSGAIFVSPGGVVFNSAGTLAYVTNEAANTVSLCNVSLIDGLLSDCATTAVGFSAPQGITLNSSGNYAYIANVGNNTVSKCTVNATTGELSSCAPTGVAFNAPAGVTLISQDARAYVANTGNNTVSLCSVDSAGEFFNCGNSGATGLTNPSSIAFN